MSEQVNEMNLPVISVEPVVKADSAVPAPAPEVAAYDDASDSVVVGSPSSSYAPHQVTVYAQSITPNTYAADSMVATFDVVFSVGIMCEDGSSKTYQVVKRIGVDKCKLAEEAMCSAPVSIVESKKEDAKATAKRFRILAGLE